MEVDFLEFLKQLVSKSTVYSIIGCLEPLTVTQSIRLHFSCATFEK